MINPNEINWIFNIQRKSGLLLTNSKKVIKTEFLNFYNYLISLWYRFRRIPRDYFPEFILNILVELDKYVLKNRLPFYSKIVWNTLMNFISNLTKNKKLLNILFDFLKSLSINSIYALKDIFSFDKLFFYIFDKIIDNTYILGDNKEIKKIIKNISDFGYGLYFFLIYVKFM